MLNTEGMTAVGIERKATVINLSSKLLYLAESELLVAQASDVVKSMDLRTVSPVPPMCTVSASICMGSCHVTPAGRRADFGAAHCTGL